jgi:hypothetical protein
VGPTQDGLDDPLDRQRVCPPDEPSALVARHLKEAREVGAEGARMATPSPAQHGSQQLERGPARGDRQPRVLALLVEADDDARVPVDDSEPDASEPRLSMCLSKV